MGKDLKEIARERYGRAAQLADPRELRLVLRAELVLRVAGSAFNPPAAPRPPSLADTRAGSRGRSAARARTRDEARG
jgi:hypothetical protein